MTVMHGYVDDSAKDNVFVLSCLQAEIGMWTWVELAWIGMLEAVNSRLRMQGRKEIARYHASDCNYSYEDFEGWTPNERKELHEQILKIFKDYAFHITAYSIDLKQLQEEIPETKPNPEGFAYVLLLYYLMLEMCDTVMRRHKDMIVGLTHDTCKFNAALREAFDQMVADPNFKCAHRFTTITPACWRHCIPLQPADFVAYENLKEAIRRKEMSRRKRRTTLRLLLDGNPRSVGGNLKKFNRRGLQHLKTIMDEMNEETKDILFRTARVRKIRNDDAKARKRSAQRD